MKYELRGKVGNTCHQGVSVSRELKAKMDAASLKYKINWSATAVVAFQKVIDDIEQQENESPNEP